MLTKETKDAFVRSVMKALPPLQEPDFEALWEAQARRLEEVLPKEVQAFRDAWPKFFCREYRGYIDKPRTYFIRSKGDLDSLSGGHWEFRCAVRLDDDSKLAIQDAVQAVNAARSDRAKLELQLRAAVAGVRTVEQLKKLYPELAEHVKVVERALPVVQDGSALIAELARAGLQFGEAA